MTIGKQLTFLETQNYDIRKSFHRAYFDLLNKPPAISGKISKQARNDILIEMAIVQVATLFHLTTDHTYTILFPRK